MPSFERTPVPAHVKGSLKKHILRERKRKEHEEAQTFALERERKEREQKKKQDSLTLEQTKDKVATLEKKLEELKSEKHKLFTQLKKVLHEEGEQKKRSQPESLPVPKIESTPATISPATLASSSTHGLFASSAIMPPPVAISGAANLSSRLPHPVGVIVSPQVTTTGMKRPRSPSPLVSVSRPTSSLTGSPAQQSFVPNLILAPPTGFPPVALPPLKLPDKRLPPAFGAMPSGVFSHGQVDARAAGGYSTVATKPLSAESSSAPGLLPRQPPTTKPFDGQSRPISSSFLGSSAAPRFY